MDLFPFLTSDITLFFQRLNKVIDCLLICRQPLNLTDRPWYLFEGSRAEFGSHSAESEISVAVGLKRVKKLPPDWEAQFTRGDIWVVLLDGEWIVYWLFRKYMVETSWDLRKIPGWAANPDTAAAHVERRSDVNVGSPARWSNPTKPRLIPTATASLCHLGSIRMEPERCPPLASNSSRGCRIRNSA